MSNVPHWTPWRGTVDHGYNIMSDATDITRRMHDLIADHVRRAVS